MQEWMIAAGRQNRERQNEAKRDRLRWPLSERFKDINQRLEVWRRARLYDTAKDAPGVPWPYNCYHPYQDGHDLRSKAALVHDLYCDTWTGWYRGDAWAWPYGAFVLAYDAITHFHATRSNMRAWTTESSGWWQWLMLLDSLPNPYVQGQGAIS